MGGPLGRADALLAAVPAVASGGGGGANGWCEDAVGAIKGTWLPSIELFSLPVGWPPSGLALDCGGGNDLPMSRRYGVVVVFGYCEAGSRGAV